MYNINLLSHFLGCFSQKTDFFSPQYVKAVELCHWCLCYTQFLIWCSHVLVIIIMCISHYYYLDGYELGINNA